MNNIPKQKINNMKINIEDTNTNTNNAIPNVNNTQFNYYKKINKFNKEKIERDENKIRNNNTIINNTELNHDINTTNNNREDYYNTITNSHRKFIRNINQNDSSGVSALLNNINNNNNTNRGSLYENKNKNRRDTTPILSHNNNKMSLAKNNTNNITMNEYINYKNIKTKGNLNSNKKGKISRTKSIDNKYTENSSYIKIKNKNNQISFIPSETNLKIEKQIEEIEKTLIQLQKKRSIYLNEYDKLPEHPKKQKDLVEKRETKKIIDELNIAINEYKIKERNLKKMYQPI